MKELETLSKTILTNEDMDVLTGIAVVCVHVAERAINAMAKNLEHEYKKKSQYDQYVKQYGRAYVDEYVKNAAAKIARGDERFAIGNTLKELQRALQSVEHITTRSISNDVCKHSNEMIAFDALQSDVNLYGKIFSLISNCDKENDIVKIESTIKILSKNWDKSRASERVFDVFNAKI